MSKRYIGFILIVLFFFIHKSAFSQRFPSDIWYEGKVYLDSQETIQGYIKYDFDNDLIQVNTENVIKTFSTRKFASFDIQDPDRRITRSFFSLPYYRVSDYLVPMLFELVEEGKAISILSREYITTESVPQYDFYTHRNYYFTRTVLAYSFYLLFPNGKIRQYHFNKGELLDHLKDKSTEIKKFVRENRLRYDRREDVIRIVKYYNSIKK